MGQDTDILNSFRGRLLKQCDCKAWKRFVVLNRANNEYRCRYCSQDLEIRGLVDIYTLGRLIQQAFKDGVDTAHSSTEPSSKAFDELEAIKKSIGKIAESDDKFKIITSD